MRSLLKRCLLCLTVAVLLNATGGSGNRAAAVVLPSETASPEEKLTTLQTAPESEPNSELENPFEQSGESKTYEEVRHKRENRAIFIILAVLLLLCAYWWTSGKLHHKIPE